VRWNKEDFKVTRPLIALDRLTQHLGSLIPNISNNILTPTQFALTMHVLASTVRSLKAVPHKVNDHCQCLLTQPLVFCRTDLESPSPSSPKLPALFSWPLSWLMKTKDKSTMQAPIQYDTLEVCEYSII